MRDKRGINDIIEDSMGICFSLWALAVSYAAYKTLQELWCPSQQKITIQSSEWEKQDSNIYFSSNLSTVRSR